MAGRQHMEFKTSRGVAIVAQLVTNLTSIHEDVGLLSGLRIQCCCDCGCRCSLDLLLLWLWRRPAAAALIRPLAWDRPYTMGAALK